MGRYLRAALMLMALAGCGEGSGPESLPDGGEACPVVHDSECASWDNRYLCGGYECICVPDQAKKKPQTWTNNMQCFLL